MEIKSYLSDFLSEVTLVAYVPYFIIFSTVIFVINLRFLSNSKYIFYIVIGTWFFRVLLAFMAPMLSVFPNLGDTHMFAAIISENYIPEQSSGVMNYIFLTGVFRLIFLNDLQTFILFQQFIYHVSVLILLICIRSMNRISVWRYSENRAVLFMLAAFFYPSSIMYLMVPLREFLIIFAVSIFVLGLVKYGESGSKIYLILGSVLILMIRPQLLPVIPVVLYFSRYNSRWYHYFPMLVMPALLLTLFSTFLYDISPRLLSGIRAGWASTHGNEVYGVFQWDGWLDVIFDYPALLLQYLLSPFPILHSKPMFSMLAAVIDLIFILPFLMWFVFLIFKYKKIFIFNPVVLFIIFSIGLSALWEAYVGGAIRHRMISIYPLFFTCVFFSVFTRNSCPKLQSDK